MLRIKNLLGPNTLLGIAIGYTLLITLAFLFPGKNVPPTKLPLDKVVHVGLNLVLVVVWLMYVLRKFYSKKITRLIVFVALGCVLYGIVIEVIQEKFIPLRHADLWDLAANITGIALGVMLFYKMRAYFRNEI